MRFARPLAPATGPFPLAGGGPEARPACGRARRLCEEASRACGRAAELAERTGAARDAAAALRIEARHARLSARTMLDGTAAAAPADDMGWLRSRRERMAERAARPRPATTGAEPLGKHHMEGRQRKGLPP